jgi:hypothetical protein
MYNVMHRSSLRLLVAVMIAVCCTQSSPAGAVDQSASQAEAQHARTGHTVLVVQEGLGQVIAFSTANVYHREIIDVGEKPHEIALTPDGSTAFVSNFGLLEVNHRIGIPGTTISVLDVRRGIERRRFGCCKSPALSIGALNRRGLLCCVHGQSRAEEPHACWYTIKQRVRLPCEAFSPTPSLPKLPEKQSIAIAPRFSSRNSLEHAQPWASFSWPDAWG